MNAERLPVSVIIPAYNESGRVGHTVREALRYATEVIVIDDASTDDTAAEAEAAGAVVHSQPVNGGYVEAIKAGFRLASHEIVVTLDADGEFDPADIPALVEPIMAGDADLVLGRRPTIARPSERVLTAMTRLLIPQVHDTGTGLRALRRELALGMQWPGVCICGTSVLEPFALGARITERPISLRRVRKPRRPAWYHIRQLWHVLWWLLKASLKRKRR